MKHLHLFESFENDEYYEEIGHDRAGKILGRGIINITNSDIEVINSILGSSHEIINSKFDNINFISCDSKIDEIYIYKMGDDYYLVEVYIESSDDYSIKRTSYVCDQIDGLKFLLKKILKENETP